MSAFRAARPPASWGIAPLGVGALVTVAAAYLAVTAGPLVGLVPLLAALLLGSVFAGYLAAPHIVVAGLIPLFATLDSLRVFVNPQLGPVKDVLVLTLAAATAFRVVQRRSAGGLLEADTVVLSAVGLLLTLYVFNLGGALGNEGFGLGWLHGVRLVAEPLLLLLVGLFAAEPRRMLRWAMASLVATAVVIAAYGVLQQILGPAGLAGLGYEYNTHIRWIGNQLRSFGTLDGPFAYAAFLLLGVVAVLFWLRTGVLAAAAGTLIGVGLLLALVRSSAVIVVALLGLWLARRRYMATAAMLGATAVVGAAAFMVSSSGATETKTVRSSPSLYLTLNGRTEVWSVTLEGPSSWPFGRGVGVIGTAADRAAQSGVVASSSAEAEGQGAVDSGYLSTVADTGFVGLAVLLVLLGRLVQLGGRAARRGSRGGWVALGFLTVAMLDALTRDSFTGFPTAYLGMLLVGLALAGARKDLADEPSAPA